ncbi:glycine dehydrogenase (decarboxylating) alpha subunit [Desulfonatronum thiosulfatophilum]|uniref:Probable glycine dehydrogenase (decarboxylating) subunit 1 n=1 Tax=Desulfonatronum thiosulfatophilum TaxID=617002 RepID=A0A1G6DZT2_9BACT|nr:aminomethyl-transferring glycine dehydrogenase subunit GcvPA [Desulfonatronum thiosulfatophilum]SDB50275.1 glycine dehydrogenase (decarboxylating) alpha subunit [Desulfonatronum thiosulfatophilum]
MPYIPHTPDEQRRMLDVIGAAGMDDLFAEIPETLRPKSFDLPEGLGEHEVLSRLEALANKNNTQLISFLGAGFYDHAIPAAVDFLTSRGEFATAYTPYQPEASQGSLQAIFEYQTAIARLLDMDFANASVYDGGTALYEAMMMAVRQTKRRRIVVDECVNPIYRRMLDCYTSNLSLEMILVPHQEGSSDMEALSAAVDENTAGVIVQNPNFFGVIQDFTDLFSHVRNHGALNIISVYPLMQAILKTPGAMGADIATAEGQSLGLPLSFGGPYLGMMTCSKALIRQMPGRIVGRTTDAEERTGYVLTLQAREQHIRRQKATSNICSNQALCAMRAIVYLCLMGPRGLANTATHCTELAHYAARRLLKLPGTRMLSPAPFANEFALVLPRPAYHVIDRLTRRGFLPGFPLGRYYSGLENVLLVACTEKNTREDIGILKELLGGAL